MGKLSYRERFESELPSMVQALAPPNRLVLSFHKRASFTSTVWQTILFTLLAGNQKDLQEKNFRDISKLLVGEKAVVSAQIPDDIEELTGLIRQGCGEWGELRHIAPNRVAAWLELHCPLAAAKLTDVIRRYAHRGVKDLDLMTDTWGLDSSPLITMVQASLGAVEGGRGEGLGTGRVDNGATEEANLLSIHQLLPSNKPILRWLANQLVGQCREAVARRELTKDACLRAVHQMRLGYHTLAQLMRQEGRLPTADPRILCLCTHYEIGLLLAPSPDLPLLHKISRRQRNWQKWDSLRFPEVMTDLPAPVQLTTHPTVGSGESVEGMLVCAGGGGAVRARACVLLSLSEAAKLRPGDVLVTRATDVGWTPLFPVLAAVVTELGGLISHGAVVAREYGLPCIVGATNATIVFKTGDELYLDVKSGKVQKIT